MDKNIKLIKTDSYYNLFPLLNGCLSGKTGAIGRGKNIIFCEDKISLFIERSVMSTINGSFNTEVFSFGSYLKNRKPLEKTLSKEGSAMVIRKLLLQLPLKCFSGNKNLLASSVFDLIILLKSAKVTLADVKNACENTNGILKNKLLDVYEIFSAYEKYLKDNGLDDQSSVLEYLPSVIDSDDEIAGADVYLVGFTALTCQTREIIKKLLFKAKSVTAILTAGDNPFLFVNETSEIFTKLVNEAGLKLNIEVQLSDYVEEARLLKDNLFGVISDKDKKTTNRIKASYYSSKREEIEQVAYKIKKLVLCGLARYKDFTICLPSMEEYKDVLRQVFFDLEIPYFLDEKKNILNHPLVKLVVNYIDAFRFNKERSRVLEFVSNPLIVKDKLLVDRFANYLYKHNVNYSRFLEPFVDEEGKEFEPIRQNISLYLSKFDVVGLLERLNAKEKIEELSIWLQTESAIERAVNEQAYAYVTNILSEINGLLGGVNLSLIDYKNVFMSGITALELSIIPQYNDAVFVGDYKECGLAKSKFLFAVGLNGSVPECKGDVSLLTDSDINKLYEIKVLVEPKIQIVNARARESLGLALCAFSEGLFLSNVVEGSGGSGNSIAFTCAEELFALQSEDIDGEFLTARQGLKNFAKACRAFSLGQTVDLSMPSAFYLLREEDAKDVLDSVNKEIKIKLDLSGAQIKMPSLMSPTTLEAFYQCPFKAFCQKTLRLTERPNGRASAANFGSIIHGVLDAFVKKVYIEKIEKVTCEEDCDKLAERLVNEILDSEDFRFLKEGEDNEVTVLDLYREAKKYCKRIYLRVDKSGFKPYKTEAKIGDGGDFPPISLANGKVKIIGTIDRVDTYKDYFRIIDYKTGSVSGAVKDLYLGNKLQLYLYALAVQGKKPAGAHYMKLEDDFAPLGEEREDMVGSVIDCADVENAFLEVDGKKGVSKEELDAYLAYAKVMGEQAVEQMSSGVIAPSPLASECTYCQYESICGGAIAVRKADSVNGNVIINAVNNDKKDDDEQPSDKGE